MSRLLVLGFALALLGAGCVRAPTTAPLSDVPAKSPSGAASAAGQTIDFRKVPEAHSAFALALTVPAGWRVEVVPAIEAVNLYDPTAPGTSPREQSQVFLRHFRARDFLTLSTVTVLSRTPTTVAGRPAVAYEIEKKPAVPDFPHQPGWRNARHRVTDIRLSDEPSAEFLVVAQNPTLPDARLADILDTLRVFGETSESVVLPASGFL